MPLVKKRKGLWSRQYGNIRGPSLGMTFSRASRVGLPFFFLYLCPDLIMTLLCTSKYQPQQGVLAYYTNSSTRA